MKAFTLTNHDADRILASLSFDSRNDEAAAEELQHVFQERDMMAPVDQLAGEELMTLVRKATLA
jgi:hypothetical protein